MVGPPSHQFPRLGAGRYDLIPDTVGNRSGPDLRKALAAGGKAAVTGFTSVPRLLGVSLRGGKDIAHVQAHATTRDLEMLSELIEAGQLRPQIDRRYPFADIAQAIAYLEQGHAKAKVVVAAHDHGNGDGAISRPNNARRAAVISAVSSLATSLVPPQNEVFCAAQLRSARPGWTQVASRPGSLVRGLKTGVAWPRAGLWLSDEQGDVLHGVAAVAEAVPARPVGLGAPGEIGGPGLQC